MVFLFQNEMSALKADNDRLQRMMHVRPLNSSQNSIAHNRTSSESLERSLSITEQPSLGKKIRSTLEIQSAEFQNVMTNGVIKELEDRC